MENSYYQFPAMKKPSLYEQTTIGSEPHAIHFGHSGVVTRRSRMRGVQDHGNRLLMSRFTGVVAQSYSFRLGLWHSPSDPGANRC